MNEPRRLREEAESNLELVLLEAGTSYRSSPNARAKTLAALGLAGSAAVSAGAVSAASSSLLSKLSWGKLLVLSSVGAGVLVPVGYMALHRAHPEANQLVSTAVPAATPEQRAKQPAAEEEPQPEIEIQPLAALPPLEEEQPSRPQPRVAPGNALGAELAALDAVRGKLASGDASAALQQLDDYFRAYPRGRLVLEAEVLRIDALSRSGQGELAKQRAESFLRRHPNSVLASRVRGYLD